MNDHHQIDSYLESNLDQSIAELSKLVAQPSVGAQNLGMRECAALVSKMLKARGFEVTYWQADERGRWQRGN